jgi:hypothetical protein
VFITKKTVAEMFYLPQSNIIKILAKSAKEKEKERKEGKREGDEGFHVSKNRPIGHLNGLKEMEGFLFKGMYVAMLLALIHVIWLKGDKLTYVAKKLLSLVVLVE